MAINTNAVNRPQAPPEATTSPESDQNAGVTLPTQRIHRNATGLPPVPSVEEEYFGDAPEVQYQTGSVNSNRSSK